MADEDDFEDRMSSIWTMGEILVEIMRPRAGMELGERGEFLGPFPSGAPAIFIDTIARLGHPAGIIGGVGEDDFGRCVLERLERDGVDCHYVRGYPGHSTAVAFVTYFADGSRKFIYHFDGTPAVMNDGEDAEQIEPAAFFHVMGCSLMANGAFREHILHTMEVFRSRGAKISFDPNIRPELLRGRPIEDVAGAVLEHCSVLLPGVAELALLSGEKDVESGVAQMFSRFPIELVMLKRGRDGCTIFSRQAASISLPAFQVKEVDPTGAGDCFDAGFLASLVEGKSLRECAQVAAAAGALNAAAFGPMEGRISRREITHLIEAQAG